MMHIFNMIGADTSKCAGPLIATGWTGRGIVSGDAQAALSADPWSLATSHECRRFRRA